VRVAPSGGCSGPSSKSAAKVSRWEPLKACGIRDLRIKLTRDIPGGRPCPRAPGARRPQPCALEPSVGTWQCARSGSSSERGAADDARQGERADHLHLPRDATRQGTAAAHTFVRCRYAQRHAFAVADGDQLKERCADAHLPSQVKGVRLSPCADFRWRLFDLDLSVIVPANCRQLAIEDEAIALVFF
jgi:hypothetical protein